MKSKRTILLFEDDEFIARTHITKLEIEGFSVTHAPNGKIGWECLQKEKPDLVILDLMMPEKTGFEILEDIKNSNDMALKAIPILITSNLAQKSDMEEVMKYDVAEFLVKSDLLPKDLYAKVCEYMPK